MGESGNSEGVWYRDGLRFECTQCGNCCTGPPGAVWFNDEEARAMAKATGCSEAEFRDKYARKLKDGWSLKEHQTQHGWDCVFLDRSTRPGLALCRLYQARPRQCRTWPFWPENLESEAAWDEARRATPCPGMGHGPLIRVEDIRISMARS